METWLIYAIVASVTAGVGGFLSKIQTENQDVSTETYMFYNFLYSFLASIFGILFFSDGLVISLENMLYWLIVVFLYFFVLKFRLKSLEYVSSSTYFINFRLFSSILLVIWGQLIFSEFISFREYIWIFLWFIIFYLLLERGGRLKQWKDLRKWIQYIIYCIILVTILQLVAKDYIISGFDPFSFVFFQWIFGILISIGMSNKSWMKKVMHVKWCKSNFLLILNGLMLYISALTNNFALQWGDVAVVYKIISYSLFIPIIFSVIFYWEKITLKKSIAFLLTIISIALFM